MKDYSVTGIIFVIIGVLLIVFGASTALGGMDKMDAAEQWEEEQSNSECVKVYSGIDEDDSFEEVQQKIDNGAGECVDTQTETNPYTGGEKDAVGGSLLVVIGGTSAYYGNKH